MPRTHVARTLASTRPLVSGRGSGGTIVTSPAAPVISNIVVDQVTQTSARINFTTDTQCTGLVNYGTTASYGSSTTVDPSAVTVRAHVISGLTANTLYHYRVRATNASAVETVGTDGTFTTLAADGTRPQTATIATYVAPVSGTMPTYLGTYSDTYFGTKVKRISNATTRRHVYASIPAWNADGTLLNLGYAAGGVRAMLNGTTYAQLQGDQSNTGTLFWSNLTATKAWCQNGTNNGYRRLTVNTTTGVVSIAATYAASSITRPGGGVYSAVAVGGVDGGIQGVQDDTDTYVAYTWKASSNDWGIGIMNLSTNTVHAERTMGNSASAISALTDNCGMSHTGAWAWFTFVADGTAVTEGMWLYETDLNTSTRRQASTSQEHCDWALNGSSADRFIYWNGNITSMDPVTGTKTVLLTPVYGGTHISGRATDYPGWVLVSQHEAGFTSPGSGTIFALDIDNPGQAKTYTFNHRTTNVGYAGEVHACPSRDLTRVVFAVNWEADSNVYAFVAGMNP